MNESTRVSEDPGCRGSVPPHSAAGRGVISRPRLRPSLTKPRVAATSNLTLRFGSERQETRDRPHSRRRLDHRFPQRPRPSGLTRKATTW